MKDIKGFMKLLDINIPCPTHFDYYIDQLAKTEKWKDIRNLISLYEDAERDYENLYEYRMSKAHQIIDYIKGTRAYLEMQDDNLIPDLPTTKNFEYKIDKIYLSIDMIKANFQALKKYDPLFAQELGDDWDSFISKFDIPEIFKQSKSFRQFIFGNLNPKKQGKAQRVIIEDLIQKYSDLNLNIACVKNDEVIYEFDSLEQIQSISVDKNFKLKIFSVERIEDFRIHTYYNKSGEYLYREMIGCNGNLFYLYLKKFILMNETPDIRDLYFRMDGKLAIWAFDSLDNLLKV